MVKWLKIVLTAAAVAILCVTLTGCNRTEVAERAFVEAIGLDRDGETLTASFQVLDAEKNTIIPYVLTGRGKTFTEAFGNAEQGQVKKLFLGHCKVIILGEGISGVGTELEYFLNSSRISPGVKLALAEGKAESLFTGEADFAKLLKQSAERGNTVETDLVRFFDQNGGTLLPIFAKTEKGVSAERAGLVTGGIRGEALTLDETRGTAAMTGEIRLMPLSVTVSDRPGTVAVSEISADFVPARYGKEVCVRVLLKVEGKAEEGLFDVPMAEIEGAVSSELKKLCASALKKSSETGADFLLLQRKMRISGQERGIFLKNAEFEISVQSKIEPQRKF